MNVVENKWR